MSLDEWLTLFERRKTQPTVELPPFDADWLGELIEMAVSLRRERSEAEAGGFW